MQTKNIIFVHGITSFGKSHIVLERSLTKLGYNFHSFDLPGHGERFDEWKTNSFKFDDMVDFVKNYINTNLKNEKFIILGHSMGGGITQVICKMFKKQITSVILECPLNLGAALSEYESDFKQLIQSDANIATLKKEINADVKKITIAKKSIKNTAPVVWEGYEVYAPLLIDVQSPQTIKKITDGCKSISAPLLLINGELDPVIVPYATIATIKTLVNKKYFHNVLIKKAMHNPFKDTPNEYIDDIKTYLEKFN